VSFLLLTRRVHLYLGMFLLPWVVMFGVSSLLLNHTAWFQIGANDWTTLDERANYDVQGPVPGDLRAVAARIIADAGYEPRAGFGAFKPNANRVNINLPSFRHPIRITYFSDQHRLLVERRGFAWGPTLRNMHTHDGYYLHAPGQTAWAVMVDILCVAILFWVASGLYMWWVLPGTRGWGWATLAASALSFGWLLARL